MNQPDVTEPPPPALRRLRGFGLHLLGYFAVMIVLVPVNLIFSPESLWFVLPLVGWGAVLSLHVAYAMGLFAVFDKGQGPER